MAKGWRIREGWGVLLLTLALTLVAGTAIGSTGWTEGMRLIPLASLGAFILGLMIAKSTLPGWIAHIFSVIIGFAWAFWLTTRLFPNTWSWEFRWAWVWWYLYRWFLALFGGGVSHETRVFVLQMAFIVWEITYLSLWFIFRTRQPWLAIVPNGILLLVNLFYAPKDITVYLVVYLALALLLVIRFNLFAQEQVWRREQVHFNADEVTFDFLRAGALFTVVILALAWITPGAVAAQDSDLLQTLRGPWRDMQSEWSRLFASLNYRPTTGVDFYSKELNLGGPRELAEVPVLEVKAPPNARYWRAVVFDKFTGRSWENTDNKFASFGADNDVLPIISYQARQAITHTVTVLGPSVSVLPMAAQPIWVDQPTRASMSFVNVPTRQATGQSDGSDTSLRVDTISSARSRVPLDAGDSYVATSHLTQASERQLRNAGTSYPTWITDRYLQLPDNVPERVKQLAQEIAEPHDTPYDQANAVQDYLRREIAYNEKINAPPPDRDPVDYILFDLKQGYCDYYATSMAVMLRSLGIPSRIVSGYAQGHYDSDREVYVVLLQDAHTWVEVFFPRYGWVEFEPTAAQPIIVRPVEPDSNAPEQQNEDRGPAPTIDPLDRMEEFLDEDVPPPGGAAPATNWWSGLDATKPGSWLFGSLVLIALAGITVWTMRNRRLARLSSVAAIYHNMLRLASWAGAKTPSSQTPHEHASALGQVLPEAERPAKHIAGLYAGERYGHKAIGESEQATVSRAWQELRPKLVRETLLRHLVRRVTARLPF